jgi:hypothetical protein
MATRSRAVTRDRALFKFTFGNGWQVLGAPGKISVMSAGTQGVGDLAAAFVLTTAGDFAEWKPTGGWQPVGGRGSILQFSALRDGAVVAVTTDHSVYEFDPHRGWFPLAGSGFASFVSAAFDDSGNEVVYAVTLDAGLTRHDANGWRTLQSSGTTSIVSVGLDGELLTPPFGRPVGYVLGTGGSLVKYDSAGQATNLAPLPGPVTQLSAADIDAVFMILADGSVFGHDDTNGFCRLSAPRGFAEV